MKTKDEFINGMWKQVQEKEVNIRILCALDKAPGKINLYGFCKEMLCNVGIQSIFHGMTDVICLAFFITVCSLSVGYRFLSDHGNDVYGVAFLSAPLLYGFIFLLSYLKEKQVNTLGIQMSCKYTFFHLLAFRMLFCSGISLLFNSAYVFLLLLRFQADGVRLFAVSFSSLLIFSVLMLAGLLGLKSGTGTWMIPGLWMTANIFGMAIFSVGYRTLLTGVPVYLLILTAPVLFLLFCHELLNVTTVQFRKGYSNAGI